MQHPLMRLKSKRESRGALNLKFLKYFSSKENYKYINTYYNAMVSWYNNEKHNFL